MHGSTNAWVTDAWAEGRLATSGRFLRDDIFASPLYMKESETETLRDWLQMAQIYDCEPSELSRKFATCASRAVAQNYQSEILLLSFIIVNLNQNAGLFSKKPNRREEAAVSATYLKQPGCTKDRMQP